MLLSVLLALTQIFAETIATILKSLGLTLLRHGVRWLDRASPAEAT
jgi:hypothetical protein